MRYATFGIIVMLFFLGNSIAEQPSTGVSIVYSTGTDIHQFTDAERSVLNELELAVVSEDWSLVSYLLDELPLRKFGQLIEEIRAVIPREPKVFGSSKSLSDNEEMAMIDEETVRLEVLMQRYAQARLLQKRTTSDTDDTHSERSTRESNGSKAILTVGPGCTYATLQEAVNAAVTGDDIWMQTGTLSGSAANVNISNLSLNLYGGANGDCSTLGTGITVLDGTGVSDSVIEIYNGTGHSIRIEDCDITGGSNDADYGGGIEISNDATVTLNNTWVYGNASTYGGGVHMTDGTLVLESGSRIYNNSALEDGGGVYCLDGTVTMTGTAYIGTSSNGNFADSDSDFSGDGGGVFLDGATLNVDASSGANAQILNNSAFYGGGISATNNSIINLDGVNAGVNLNSSESAGGGIFLIGGSQLWVDQGSVNNNTSGYWGGGIYANGSGTMADFDTNILCAGSKCTQLSYNSASSHGGAAFVTGGAELDLKMVYIEGNSSNTLGSAIYATGTGTLLDFDSVMITEGNAGSNHTIRLYSSAIPGPTALLDNCTIAGNTGHSSATLAVDDHCRFDGFGLIIYGNDGSTLVEGNGDVSIDCSILDHDFPGNRNQVSNPQFMDDTNGNYHISHHSPALDHCNGTHSRDIDYETRPFGVYMKSSTLPDKIRKNNDNKNSDTHVIQIHLAELDNKSIREYIPSANRIVDYGSMVWLELSAAQFADLKASGLPYQEVKHYGLISFGSFYLDPVVDGEPLSQLGNLKGTSTNSNGYGLYLVQVKNPPTDQEMEELSSLVTPIQYYPHLTYLVWANDKGMKLVNKKENVRWSGLYHDGYRISSRLKKFITGNNHSGMTKIKARILDDDSLNSIADMIRTKGGTIYDQAKLHAMNEALNMVSWEFEYPINEVSHFVHLPQVITVDLVLERIATDERSDQIIADNAPGGEPVLGYTSWLNTTGFEGYGVTVAIVDSGVDWDHPDLTVVSGTEYGGAWSEAGEPGSDGGGSDAGHGTHVAGIVNANGTSAVTDSDGFIYGLGVAPNTTLHAIDLLDGGTSTQQAFEDAASNADLSNNSWGYTGSAGDGYTAETANHDDWVLDAIDNGSIRDPFFASFAAGNAGNCGTSPCLTSCNVPTEAKNVITVGNTLSRRSNTSGGLTGDINSMRYTSSRGFAVDGRFKPDVVAPGTNVVSTENTDPRVACTVSPPESTQHSFCSGTSMSSPHVAGIAALFTEFWRLHNNTTINPLPSMVKAALIGTTDDIGGGDDGFGTPISNRPNEHQGWGRVNADRLLNPPVNVQYFQNPQLFVDTGDYWQIRIYVNDLSEPLRVTLVWSDAPGAPDANPALVNDLDLVVFDPDSLTFRGNNFGIDGWSVSGGSFDALNNVENVWIENPKQGSYYIEVDAFAINGDAFYYNGDATDQHFSLYCYNCELVETGEYDAGADEAYEFVGINGNYCEYATIADAVAAASSGDTIYLPSGSYYERIGTVDKNLDFIHAVNDCTAEDVSASRHSLHINSYVGPVANGGVLYVPNSSTVTMKNMILNGGEATWGGGIWSASGSDILLDGVDIIYGSATTAGGGIRTFGSAEMINESRIYSCETTGSGEGGGASVGNSGTLILRDISKIGEWSASYDFANTSATNGGGVFLDGGRLEMYDSSDIRHNTASNAGGGICAANGAEVFLHDEASIGYDVGMDGNYAAAGGGVYLVDTGTTLNMSQDSIIQYNHANLYGGGMYISDGASATINSSEFYMNNASSLGGGMYVVSMANPPTVDISNLSSIRENTCDGGGGGIYVSGEGMTVTIDNSSIDNNSADYGGGIRLNGASTVSLQNGSTVTSNDATVTFGGGIAVGSDGILNINGATISGNTALTDGGGVYSSYGLSNSLELNDVNIQSNTATTGYGGGICHNYGSLTVRAQSTASTVSDNSAGLNGGGIYHNSGNSLQIRAINAYQMQINANDAGVDGGGIYVTNTGDLDSYGLVEMNGNVAANNGGAIYLDGGTGWLDDYTYDKHQISNNSATSGNGGAFYVTNVTELVLDGVELGLDAVGNNAPAGAGGGMYIDNSTVELDTCSVQNNTCQDDGGGLWIGNGSIVTITPSLIPPVKTRPEEADIEAYPCDTASLAADRYCSEFRYNQTGGSSGQYGGAIHLSGGSSVDISSTGIMENMASVGSAIYAVDSADSVTIDDCRISDNSGSLTVRLLNTETLVLENSTLAGNNSSAVGIANDLATATFNNNIIWDNAGGTSIYSGVTILGGCNNTQDNSLPGISLDPLFVTTSRGNYHLGPGSPSVDACGTGAAIDLDNRSRPIDGDGSASTQEYDMGAFEREEGSAVSPPTPGSSDNHPDQPMTADKIVSGGSQIQIQWNNILCPATEYILVYGDLSSVSSYSSTGCNSNIDPDINGSYDWTSVPAGNLWYVVVGSNGTGTESSWGTDSSLNERDGGGPSTCSTTKDTSGTCP